VVCSLLKNRWITKLRKEIEFEPTGSSEEKAKSVMMAGDDLEKELDEDKYEKKEKSW
jgi:hypothetical protein